MSHVNEFGPIGDGMNDDTYAIRYYLDARRRPAGLFARK
jgi:hypothetical protein